MVVVGVEQAAETVGEGAVVLARKGVEPSAEARDGEDGDGGGQGIEQGGGVVLLVDGGKGVVQRLRTGGEQGARSLDGEEGCAVSGRRGGLGAAALGLGSTAEAYAVFAASYAAVLDSTCSASALSSSALAALSASPRV